MVLSDLSIRKPVFAWMLMSGLIIFGALSFNRLGVSQMPDVDFPVVSVNLSLLGAAPEVMETQVVDPVEDAVMEIEGIRSVNSSSRQGSANISVEFELNRDIDVAVQEVQARISQVRKLLPAELYPPVIRKSNPEDQPILWLTVSNDGTMPKDRMMRYTRNVLLDQFSTLEGVGDIAQGGYVDSNLRVWVSLPKLREFELSVSDVVAAIQAEHVELPAGRIENAEKEFNVRFMGEAMNPEEFGKIVISRRGGGPNYRTVRLREVARIEEGLADVRRISRYNGKLSVGLGVLKQHGSNAVEVAKAVRNRVTEIQGTLPKGLTLEVRMDSTRFIKQSVDELNFTLILSALLTSIVCYFFLGSWSSTLNVLMSIPTSIVGTFIVLYFFHFTLNTFTLLGLSLAIGIVVDDAIMMLENIVRHGEMGKKRRLAAIDGAREITFAALAATIAIVAIFLPVVFMDGVIGKYFYQYGITVTAAVMLSLLEALTLTPMRCSRFLHLSSEGGRIATWMNSLMSRLGTIYSQVLAVSLNHPGKTVGLSLLLFALSLGIAKRLPSEMIPAQDQAQILLRLKAPVGSAMPFTDDKFRIVEKYLSEQREVTGYYSTVGGFGGDAVNEGNINVSLKDPGQRKLTQRELMEKFRKELKEPLKGVKVIAQDLSLRGFSSSRGFPVEFTIQGPNWAKLTELTETMMDRLNESEFFEDVNTDYQVGMPEVQILPDRKKAADRGVALTTISDDLNSLIGGAVLNSTTRYSKEGHRYDINVRLEANERTRAEDLNSVFLRNNRGEMIPLSKLVSVQEKPSLQIITRNNRERAIRVHANIATGNAQDIALKKVEEISKEVLPQGYHILLGGNAQTFRESFRSLLIALILGIFVSYMVLASQFNSFLHPISVLMALPFSVSGAFVALYLGHQSLNMFSIIGLILLLGIVKKNSILLVDFTNQKRQEGMSTAESLLVACPVRLRPILMTSVATIAGALPVALAIGPGSETRVPMAMAIIGGVLVSTLLTLVVVPSAYLLLSRFESKPIPQGTGESP